MIIKVIRVINPTSVRQFIRDYRLPISATAIFVAVVILMVIGRLQDRSVLGQILAVNNSGSQGYANLLSKDKADLFTKNDVGDSDTSQTSGSRPSPGTSSSQSSASGSTNNTTAPGGATNPGTGETNPPTPAPNPGPAPVFGASITDFRQDQTPALQCSGGSLINIGNLNKCTKTYSFVASVQSVNGPGLVSYGWRYSVAGSNDGLYSAASGTDTATLRDEITLNCKDPGTFTAQFVLNGPNAAKSQTLQLSHSCTR